MSNYARTLASTYARALLAKISLFISRILYGFEVWINCEIAHAHERSDAQRYKHSNVKEVANMANRRSSFCSKPANHRLDGVDLG